MRGRSRRGERIVVAGISGGDRRIVRDRCNLQAAAIGALIVSKLLPGSKHHLPGSQRALERGRATNAAHIIASVRGHESPSPDRCCGKSCATAYRPEQGRRRARRSFARLSMRWTTQSRQRRALCSPCLCASACRGPAAPSRRAPSGGDVVRVSLGLGKSASGQALELRSLCMVRAGMATRAKSARPGVGSFETPWSGAAKMGPNRTGKRDLGPERCLRGQVEARDPEQQQT
jgi:hypothetical protein